jgi:glycerol-3-phosphate dehydrogenase
VLPPLPPARSPVDRRSEKLQRLRAETFDLLIIGGGITGAGVAREAALRRWRVALVERGDFGGGTSSRSARIIHGGLRYILLGQFDVVYAACAERRGLLRYAPHLVKPLPHTAAVYDKLSRALVVRGGLLLYDALGLYQNPEPQRNLSRRALAKLEPSFARDHLITTVRYSEAVGDDARLTLTTILAAERLGALALNYMPVVALLKAHGRVTGAAVRDALSGQTLEIRARAVVNASGPWNPLVQKLDRPDAHSSMHPSKGIHLIVPRERLWVNDAVVFRATDGRRDMYALPWRNTTLIGTTDVDYPGDPDEVYATGDEVRQVLASTQRAFPAARLTEADLLSTYAGVRPLVEHAGQGAYKMSREHRVSVSDSGLISITGGKLTTHRRMARDTVEAAARQLGLDDSRSRAAARRLQKLPLEEAAIPAAGAERLPAEDLAHLQAAYGARWGHVAALALQVPGLEARLTPALPYLKAELAFAVQHELALTLSDVMLRRTHLIHEDAAQGLGLARLIAESLAGLLGWSPDETARQVQAYEHQVALTRRYREE